MTATTTIDAEQQKLHDTLIGMPLEQVAEAEKQIEWMASEMKRLNAQTEASKIEAGVYAAETRMALQKLKTDLGIA